MNWERRCTPRSDLQTIELTISATERLSTSLNWGENARCRGIKDSKHYSTLAIFKQQKYKKVRAHTYSWLWWLRFTNIAVMAIMSHILSQITLQCKKRRFHPIYLEIAWPNALPYPFHQSWDLQTPTPKFCQPREWTSIAGLISSPPKSLPNKNHSLSGFVGECRHSIKH